MKRRFCARFFRLLALVSVALVLWSCAPAKNAHELEEYGFSTVTLDALLDAQLGLLRDEITVTERATARLLLGAIQPLRAQRLKNGSPYPGLVEMTLQNTLNRVYEKYTWRYLDDGAESGWGEGWDATEDERYLAMFTVDRETAEIKYAGKRMGLRRLNEDIPKEELAQYEAIWAEVGSILPEGALCDFAQFSVWTDGRDGTLAFVQRMDDAGEEWEIAIDPADAADEEDLYYFVETVIHEYMHYVTLNATEVDYTEEKKPFTYLEWDFTSHQDSYINQFYRRFWAMTLEDRLAEPDGGGFYLRHEDEFVNSYAATDPSEDIAESFTYFVLLDAPEGEGIVDEKLRFFYEFDELVALRDAIRENFIWEEEAA